MQTSKSGAGVTQRTLGCASSIESTEVARVEAFLRGLSRIEAEEVADVMQSLGADGAEAVGASSSTIKLRLKAEYRHSKPFQPSEQWRA